MKNNPQKMFLVIIILLMSTSEVYLQMKTNYEKISGSTFRNFLEKVDAEPAAEKKQLLVEEFINNLPQIGYPLFENDSTVILLYKGNKDTVEIIGDMTDWAYSVPMQKISGTNLYYYRGTYEPAARLEYWLEFSKLEFPSVDTLNKYKSANGFGDISELAMPAYIRHPLFNDYMYGKKGETDSLKEIKLPLGVLPYEHTINIYLPPGYDGGKKYPVVYFQDGKEYIDYAYVSHVLSELQKDNEIEPLIAVLVTPPNLHQPKVPNRMTEYGMNDDYVKFFTEELVNYIDSNYSTRKNAESRLVVGDSYGGLISTYISFMRPDIFKLAYSQSGYHSFSKDKMINLISSSETKPIKLYIDTGTYERKVGVTFLPAGETDFLLGNRRLKAALEKKNYNFVYKEYYEGHTWGNWRRHLIDALIYFFGKS